MSHCHCNMLIHLLCLSPILSHACFSSVSLLLHYHWYIYDLDRLIMYCLYLSNVVGSVVVKERKRFETIGTCHVFFPCCYVLFWCVRLTFHVHACLIHCALIIDSFCFCVLCLRLFWHGLFFCLFPLSLFCMCLHNSFVPMARGWPPRQGPRYSSRR